MLATLISVNIQIHAQAMLSVQVKAITGVRSHKPQFNVKTIITTISRWKYYIAAWPTKKVVIEEMC